MILKNNLNKLNVISCHKIVSNLAYHVIFLIPLICFLAGREWGVVFNKGQWLPCTIVLLFKNNKEFWSKAVFFRTQGESEMVDSSLLSPNAF